MSIQYLCIAIYSSTLFWYSVILFVFSTLFFFYLTIYPGYFIVALIDNIPQNFFLIVAKYTCCTSGKATACQCRRCGFEPRVGEIPSREGMASQSSILAWRIQWTVECDRLQSIVLQRVGHD